jgi:hypothetical protein
MKRQIKVWGVLLMIVMVSSYAVALQKPALQQAGTSIQSAMSGQDVITASDAGGGYLSTGDIILIVIIGLAIVGLIAIL